MRCVSFRQLLPVILALWCIDPPAGGAVITYHGGACAYVRIFTPGEPARESFNCPNQLPTSYSSTASVDGFGMHAQAQQTTTGAFLPDSMRLDSTGSAILTVGSVAQGSGGLVLSQFGITFQNDATRPFTLMASLSGANAGGSFIQLTNWTTNSPVFSCNTSGPCVGDGVLAAGSYSLFVNVENRRNAGGADVFGALSAYEFHLTVGSPIGPTATPTPTAPVISWINPAGGDFGEASNWDPPEVPVVDAERADNAAFTLTDTYAVNVAGAHTNRIIIRNSSIDLVGGTAEATSTSLAEPSLVVGQNGKLHLVSGTLTSVDSVLGDVSGALAEVDLISGTPTWKNTGRLTIGDAGPGRLTVVAGQVTSAESRIGGGSLGAGEAIVGGPGAWTTGNLGLGFGGGPGTLEIEDGGVVTSDGAVIGVAVSDGNRVDVRGATAGGDPSQWNVTGMLEVGGAGIGALAIRDGAHVGTASLKIGALGDVTIGRDAVGADTATLDVSGTVTIAGGQDANNLTRGLIVGGGAALTAGEIVVEHGLLVGNGDILTGTLTIRKDGNALLSAGAVGVAQADVTVDGLLDFRSDSVGDLQGGLIIGSGAEGAGVAGTVTFEKTGSEAVTATIANGVFLGNGLLSITGGPTLTVGGAVDIGTSAVAGDAAQVFVDDPNGNGPSTLTVTQGKIDVGVLGPGQLSVSEGSSVTTPALALGGAPGARGDVFIENATLTTTGDVAISDQAIGIMNLTGGPKGAGLVVGGAITIGTPFAGGAIFLSDGGRVSAANGITVNASSFIAGSGTIAANVTVNAGGEVKAGVSVVPPAPLVAPKSARPKTQAERALASRAARADTPRSRALAALPSAVLTITGDLSMSPGSTLRVEIDGSEDGLPALLVQGGATLAGTLEIAFVDGFVPRAGDELRLFEVLGLASGTFTNMVVTGLPPGWKGDLSGTGAALALTVFGDYLCYQTSPARGAKFPKALTGALDTAGGPFAFGIKKPVLLCNPSGPTTGSGQANDTQLRGYAITDPSADRLGVASRTLRVTNALHDLVVDTGPVTLALAPAAKCVDVPAGTCPGDLAPPAAGDAYVCVAAKRDKSAPAFPKMLVASAVDGFGEPRSYRLTKPSRVCVLTNGDLDNALACYAAKPLGKACAVGAPQNATGPCAQETDCGGVKKVTTLCTKQGKHARLASVVLSSTLARDRAATVKPIELCVPSELSTP